MIPSNKFVYYLKKAKKRSGALFGEKIFCISLQRTGTTSVGKFFKKNGYQVANYSTQRKNSWTKLWFSGDIEKIFRSFDFITSQVFEDDPWWCGQFYKKLYHRFNRSKFILFERDPDDWFDSMLSHSEGKNPGNTYLHSFLYNRGYEFYNIFGSAKNAYTKKIDNMLNIEGMRSHYKKIYTTRNERVKDFFENHNKKRLFYAHLYDDKKWSKMANYFDINVGKNISVHANKSSDSSS